MDSGATNMFIATDVVARLGLQPVPAEQLEVTLADESVFICSEKVDVPVVFGAMGTFGEHYPCTLTCLVAGRLHQDVILGVRLRLTRQACQNLKINMSICLVG